MSDIPAEIIRLYGRESNCVICDLDMMDCRQGLPMFEGEVVGSDATEWAGFDACPSCYALWKEGGAAAINAYAKALQRRRAQGSARGGRGWLREFEAYVNDAEKLKNHVRSLLATLAVDQNQQHTIAEFRATLAAELRWLASAVEVSE